MISTSEPGVKGDSECESDGMSHEGHRQQSEKGITGGHAHEGSSEQTAEEKREASK